MRSALLVCALLVAAVPAAGATYPAPLPESRVDSIYYGDTLHSIIHWGFGPTTVEPLDSLMLSTDTTAAFSIAVTSTWDRDSLGWLNAYPWRAARWRMVPKELWQRREDEYVFWTGGVLAVSIIGLLVALAFVARRSVEDTDYVDPHDPDEVIG